jgi:hypothetical protein
MQQPTNISVEYNSYSTANKPSASQEISHIFWNPKLFTRTHHFSLSWSRSVQSISSQAIHFNIIVPSTSTFYKWSPLFRFPYQNSVLISHLPTCVIYRIPNSILTHLLKKGYTNAWTAGKLSELWYVYQLSEIVCVFWCWWMRWRRTWRLLSCGMWYLAAWLVRTHVLDKPAAFLPFYLTGSSTMSLSVCKTAGPHILEGSYLHFYCCHSVRSHK